MKRGDLFRVYKPSRKDPKKFCFFVIVSRQPVIDSRLSTVVCAPIYTNDHDLSTEVPVGTEEGLRHPSSIHCDELMSLAKSTLTHFISSLPLRKINELDQALKIALDLDGDLVH